MLLEETPIWPNAKLLQSSCRSSKGRARQLSESSRQGGRRADVSIVDLSSSHWSVIDG